MVVAVAFVVLLLAFGSVPVATITSGRRATDCGLDIGQDGARPFFVSRSGTAWAVTWNWPGLRELGRGR